MNTPRVHQSDFYKLEIMKSLSLLFVCLGLLSNVTGQCEADVMPYPKGGALATDTLNTGSAETGLELDVSSFKTSWAKAGSEATVVTIFVDGKYQQDVILFTGEEDLLAAKPKRQSYKIFLGELPKGSQKVEAFLNRKRSAPNANYVAVHRMDRLWSSLRDYEMMRNVPKTSQEYSTFEDYRARLLARANSPFIYARPNTIDKFSDIPLLTYYEKFNEPDGVIRVRYSTIFSNEDGGTQSQALMARWGRVVDIEWIYEMRIDKDGKIFDETYQGANHVTKKFEGRREFGSHPLLYVATDNNNFSDTGCSPLRFALEAVEVDLSTGSRETLMEKFPWMYKVMAEEMIREGRIGKRDADSNTILDLREYAYIEVFAEQENSSISIELDSTDGKIVTSDHGNPLLRVGRSGYFRIAVPNPSKDFPSSVKVRCYSTDPAKKGSCRNMRVVKVIKLDKEFSPAEVVYAGPAKSIKPGEAASFTRKDQ